MMDTAKKNYLERVPFRNDGANIVFEPEQNREIVWGHQFDAGVGYRIYIRYADGHFKNVFHAHIVRELTKGMFKMTKDTDSIYVLSKIRDMAYEVDRLNTLWAQAGSPPQPLDQIGEAGHA